MLAQRLAGRRLRVHAARRRARPPEPDRRPAGRGRGRDPVPARARRHGPRRPVGVDLRPLGGRRRRRRGARPRRPGHEGPGRGRDRRGDLARQRRAGARRAASLKVVVTADEEMGAGAGAKWLCEEHPEAVRSDLVVNEGGGPSFELGGRRFYTLCVGEKGVNRFLLRATGRAGHASVPALGDNALLKLAPALARLRDQPPLEPTPAGIAFLEGLLGERARRHRPGGARGRGRAAARALRPADRLPRRADAAGDDGARPGRTPPTRTT